MENESSLWLWNISVFLLELGFILHTHRNFNILHAYNYINSSNINAKQVAAVIHGATGIF